MANKLPLLLFVFLLIGLATAQDSQKPLEVQLDLTKSTGAEFTLIIKNPIDIDAIFSFIPKEFRNETNESTGIIISIEPPVTYALKPGEERETYFNITNITQPGVYIGYITMNVHASNESVSVDKQIILDVTQSPSGEISESSGVETAIFYLCLALIAFLIYRWIKRKRSKTKEFKRKITTQNEDKH